MTAAGTATPEQQTAGVCWDCGGPCRTSKGSEHGWRCTACVNSYFDAGAAKCAARDAKESAKRDEKLRAALDAQRDKATPSVERQ